MKQILKLITIFFFSLALILFVNEKQEIFAVCGTYPKLECGSVPGPSCQANPYYLPDGTLVSKYSGNSAGYNCANNYTKCYEGSGNGYGCYVNYFSCTDSCAAGSGSTGGGTRDKNNVYGPDCPAGTKINTNKEVSRFCFPGEVIPGWRPADDRYVLGSAQRTGACCAYQSSPAELSDWYCGYQKGPKGKECGFKNNGEEKCCRDTLKEEETWCSKSYTVTYACDPVAPPVTVASTVQTSGETYGCSATAGYIGRNANNTLRISVTTPQTYASGTATDIRLWAGPVPLASENFSTTNNQALDTNNHFGLVVKKVNNAWSEIYAPTKYNTSNTAQSTLQGWSKIGDINQTLTINGTNGKPMILVRNMAVTQSGTNLIFTADLSFNHDGLGLSNFERATNAQYAFRGGARYSNSSGNTAWVVANHNFKLDLTPPSNDNLSVSLLSGQTKVNLAWTFSDVDPATNTNLGVTKVVGNAERTKGGRVEDTINRETPAPAATSDYVLGSVAKSPAVYGGSGNLLVSNRKNKTR